MTLVQDDTLAAVYRTICAEPGSETHRLVYADLVEDEDPGFAEFIRLQCALARLPPPPKVVDLPERGSYDQDTRIGFTEVRGPEDDLFDLAPRRGFNPIRQRRMTGTADTVRPHRLKTGQPVDVRLGAYRLHTVVTSVVWHTDNRNVIGLDVLPEDPYRHRAERDRLLGTLAHLEPRLPPPVSPAWRRRLVPVRGSTGGHTRFVRRRGFVEKVWCVAANWADRGRDFCREYPVTSVDLVDLQNVIRIDPFHAVTRPTVYRVEVDRLRGSIGVQIDRLRGSIGVQIDALFPGSGTHQSHPLVRAAALSLFEENFPGVSFTGHPGPPPTYLERDDD